MNKPDWNSAPDWAIAWAVDKNRRGFFFENIPVVRGEIWSLVSERVEYSCLSSSSYGWEKSLELRPGLFDEPDVQDKAYGTDAVNNPSHYAQGGVECIDSIESSLSDEAFLGYLKGNVQKYLWRYEKKENPVQDLQKAKWYLDRLIEKESSRGEV